MLTLLIATYNKVVVKEKQRDFNAFQEFNAQYPRNKDKPFSDKIIDGINKIKENENIDPDVRKKIENFLQKINRNKRILYNKY